MQPCPVVHGGAPPYFDEWERQFCTCKCFDGQVSNKSLKQMFWELENVVPNYSE
jgi:hypothetical protein